MPSCRGLAMEGWKGVSSLARYVKKGGSGLGYPPVVFIVCCVQTMEGGLMFMPDSLR